METVQDIITDKQIDICWGNANFGRNASKRDLIANGVLKCASGYCTGHTMQCILEDLGMVTKQWELTPRGRAYLYAAFSNNISV